MADTIKSSSELKITWNFADGDTRTQAVKNPKSNLQRADLIALQSSTVNTQPIIGDKSGAAVTGIKTAFTIDKTNVFLDIGA